MKVGDTIEVKDNLLDRSVKGIVTQVEICFFRVRDGRNGGVVTFHWNDNIDVLVAGAEIIA